MIWFKRISLAVVIILVGGALVFAFRPQPVRVDVGTVERGPMEVTVRDDGRTRLRERYVVSTPVGGRLRRIELKVGDPIVAGETILARVEPTAPELLDPRDRATAEARVRAAEGRLRRAEAELKRVKADLEQAGTNQRRIQRLLEQGASTETQLEQATLRARMLTEEVRSAEFLTEIAAYELEQERAALLHVSKEDSEPSAVDFEIPAPISGRVLNVVQESSAVLPAGAELLEVGDPQDLEVVVDVLSSDAVRIEPGQRVTFEHWGGDPLSGTVRLVEPSGFTKVSALGVEEQRVNVVMDFAVSLHERLALGDGYRVEARIVVWESDDVLMVPSGALFRVAGDWSVFVVDQGRAQLRRVVVGRSSGLRAQVLEGLQPGDVVIMYPSDEITDGTRVEPRNP